jgi:uncharacterized protein YbjT (DUF2867 family)
MRIHILGGDPAVAEIVAEAARSRGHEPARASELGSTEAGPAGKGAAGPGPAESGSAGAVIDLGLPPTELAGAADPVAAERERARRVAGSIPESVRLVRVSLLGADPGAPAWLARAAAAAEEAQAGHAVVLRAGVLIGDLGLIGALRRRVERFRIIPWPGLSRVRLEPLDATDLGAYAVSAATATGSLDPVYDLGCGEMSSGSLLVRDLADNLGVERWILPVPRLFRWLVARWLSTPEAPAVWIDGMLEALPLLMPRRMTAWEHFDVRPTDLRTAFARAAGMDIPLRPRKEEGQAFAWKRPRKKGILWTKRR